MKLPLVLTAIILFVGSFWGIYETRVLTVLRARHLEITREAAMLGITADLSQALPQTKATKRQPADRTTSRNNRWSAPLSTWLAPVRTYSLNTAAELGNRVCLLLSVVNLNHCFSD